MAEACEAYLATNPPSPFRAFAESARTLAGRRGAALDAQGPIRGSESPIRRSLDAVSRSARDLLAVPTKDGETYYFDRSRPPHLQAGAGGQALLVGRMCVAPGKTRQRVIKVAELVDDKPKPAPVIALVRRLDALLSAYKPEQWNTIALDACDMVRLDTATHPVLRVTLLTALVRTAVKTAYGVDEPLNALMEKLDRVDTAVAWMNPDDKDARQSRRDAERLLGRLTPFSLVARQSVDAVKQATAARPPTLQWKAVLWQTDAGRWTSKPTVGPGRYVLAATAIGQSSTLTLHDLSVKRSAGQVEISEPDGLLREGTPLFLAR